MPNEEESDAEINEEPSEEEEELTQEAPDEAVDEWKLVEMARVVAEKNGGNPDYAAFTLTPDQFKILEMAFEMWISQSLDKQTYSLENLTALVKRKGAEVAANKAAVDAVHAEAEAFYINCPKFDSQSEFMKNVHKKEKVDEKAEAAKARGKTALLGAFGSKGAPPPD
jgi:hypothetical protein